MNAQKVPGKRLRLVWMSVRSWTTGESTSLGLDASWLSSQRIQIKGLPGTMILADHSSSFGIIHTINITLSQTQELADVSWTQGSLCSFRTGAVWETAQLNFCLQHVTRESLNVSQCELWWWHAEAERNGGDLQATAVNILTHSYPQQWAFHRAELKLYTSLGTLL